MKKRYYGIIPAIAAVTLIAGGYATWIFSASTTTSTSLGVTIEKKSVGATGAWTVDGINNNYSESTYKLILDQPKWELNPDGAGAYFQKNLNIYFTPTDVSSFDTSKYTFTITFTLNSTLTTYVNFSYNGSNVTSGTSIDITNSVKSSWNAESNAKCVFYSSNDSGSLVLTPSYVTNTEYGLGNDKSTASNAATTLRNLTNAITITAAITAIEE